MKKVSKKLKKASKIHQAGKIESPEELRRKYEFIINTVKEPVILINRDYIYEAANDAYCEAHDKAREDIVGKTVTDVWGEGKFKKIIKKQFAKCFRGEEDYEQAHIKLAALGERDIETLYYPYHNSDGKITHAVVIGRDMSERKKHGELKKMMAKLLCADKERDKLLDILVGLKDRPFWSVVLHCDLEDSQIVLLLKDVDYPLYVQSYLQLVRLVLYRRESRYLLILGDGGIGLVTPLFNSGLNNKTAFINACRATRDLLEEYAKFRHDPTFFTKDYERTFGEQLGVRESLIKLKKQLKASRAAIDKLPGLPRIGIACGMVRFAYNVAQGDMRDIQGEGPILWAYRARQVNKKSPRANKRGVRVSGRDVFVGSNPETEEFLIEQFGSNLKEICLDRRSKLWLLERSVRGKRNRGYRAWEVVKKGVKR